MVYCEGLGYNYTLESTKEGDLETCKLPDGSSVDAWEFLKGKVAQEFSYCRLKNYGIKTVEDPVKCMRLLTDECAVCALENGTEVEVTELMGLSFEEGKCGDGVCAIGENYNSCSQDCPSGSKDTFCDGVSDGICDPDCIALEMAEKDPDCITTRVTTTTKITTTTIQLCNKNNECEPRLGENYRTCPQDCPSGSEDGYCDGVSDGICDPDCTEKEDPDCKKPSMLWVYIIVGIVIIVLLIVFFMKIGGEEIERTKPY
ncbi:MAG: DUF333 domain-containing protein [Candidatus Aenigmarchaeota archaeon]|nr:DUF333 domain-containing protein [Candidatus Aenigmarchaeota archaeon]